MERLHRELYPCERDHNCSVCGSPSGELCTKSSGAIAARPHKSRLGADARVALVAADDPPAPESPAPVREATESPTTGRVDPSSVVRPGETPIFEALVAERMAAARR